VVPTLEDRDGSGAGGERDRIADPYIQLNHADQTGTLGPCVQAIVDAHGGSVAATSDPGKSTTFRIRLPGFRPAAEDHAPAEVPEKIEIASA
jgi:nitrogen-specific signal transduction histidine kinase